MVAEAFFFGADAVDASFTISFLRDASFMHLISLGTWSGVLSELHVHIVCKSFGVVQILGSLLQQGCRQMDHVVLYLRFRWLILTR